MKKGQFFSRDGVVSSEKVIPHDRVTGTVTSGTGSIGTHSYEIQEFFLEFNAAERREHFRVEGNFRVAAGDSVRVIYYDFQDTDNVPDWVKKVGGSEFANGVRAVGFVNHSTGIRHAAQQAMPYATYFNMLCRNQIPEILFWLSLIAASGIAFWTEHPIAAISLVSGGLVGLGTMGFRRSQIKRGEYADLFDDYRNLEHHIIRMA